MSVLFVNMELDSKFSGTKIHPSLLVHWNNKLQIENPKLLNNLTNKFVAIKVHIRFRKLLLLVNFFFNPKIIWHFFSEIFEKKQKISSSKYSTITKLNSKPDRTFSFQYLFMFIQNWSGTRPIYLGTKFVQCRIWVSLWILLLIFLMEQI